MRSKGSHGVFAPTPFPSPAAGEGDSIYNLYIKMRRRHLESVSAALYGRCQSIVRIQPQLSGKGALGHSPKRVLPTFARTKVGPRRVGVLALHPAKSPRRRRRLPIWLKNTFAPFLHRKVTPPPGWRTVYAFAKGPRRQATTNPPLIRTTNPSFCFPIKPTIYTILAQYLPKM